MVGRYKTAQKNPRRYKTEHAGKSKAEIEFYKAFTRYPSERELAQWLPWFLTKNKIKQDEQYYIN